MKYHFISLLCLVAAVLAYMMGLGSNVFLFVVAGVVLESVFWFRLFRAPRVH